MKNGDGGIACRSQRLFLKEDRRAICLTPSTISRMAESTSHRCCAVNICWKPRVRRRRRPLASLSRREFEVFSFLVDGIRPKDIAKLLDISPKTVDTYRSNIMRKLGIHDLVGLVKFAINRNLTSVSNPQVSS